MSQGSILWIGLLVLLAAFFLLTLRRLSVLIRRTRDLERFQRASEGFAQRLAATTGPLVRDLDALRRRTGDPDALTARIPEARAELARLAAEGRSLSVPDGLASLGAAMAGELERAFRAATMIAMGLAAMSDARGGRDLEVQTAFKRGTLNLRNATDAYDRLLVQARAVRPADLARGTGLPMVAGTGTLTTYNTDDDEPIGRL